MAMNSFENRNFMEPMGMPKHAFKVPCFFFLLSFVGGKIFFHFSLVPSVFPSSSSSHQIFNMFLKFPMGSHRVLNMCSSTCS
jgi:hypothetical protein